MAKRQVFYSFHYEKDVFRVQQIRNMGALEGNEPVAPNEWENVKRGGDLAIKQWIDQAMASRSCLVVLIGTETAYRKWVKYEIEKAWKDRKGIVGIHINNLKDQYSKTSNQGMNPFYSIKAEDGTPLSALITCHTPNSWDAYRDIQMNLERWIEAAVEGNRF